MIIGLFPELLSSGGVQRVGRHTAAVLAAYAEESRKGYAFLSLNDPPGLHRQTAGVQSFTFTGFGRAKGALTLKALRLALQNCPMVISAHPNLVPVAWAMKAMGSGLKSIVLTHGIEVWTPLDQLRKWALRRADLVLAPSADTAGRVVNIQGVPAEHVRQLPWGLDPEFAEASDSTSFKDAKPRLPEGRVVLSVGRLAANERYKGLDVIILALSQAISLVPDLHLVVVGDGDDRPRLENLAREKHLTERVCFLGDLGQEELIACYQRCDVFAMPSRGEGFGLVFLEAMALGKPVIGPNNGAPTEFIRHGEHGLLVDPEDPHALAGALIDLLTAPQRAQRMGQAARQWVLREYSFERFRERLYCLLSDHLLN